MEAAIQIPEPTPQDSETVVTALETAALFGAKGDATEALRWLQRAAESAGESGDDARTLTLARTAAELSQVIHAPPTAKFALPPELSEAAPLSARRMPKPPPRPPSPAHHPHEESPPSASRPTLADGPPAMPSGRPPPPSARAASRAPLPVPPIPEERVTSAAEVDATDPDGQRLTQPAPAPQPSLLPPAGTEIQRLRQAARVSIVESSEPGLFLVRLLDEGSPAPRDTSEAFLVLVDPNDGLFRA